MNTILKTTGILLLIILLVGCVSERNTTTELVIARDVTDSIIEQPKPEEIFNLFGLTENPLNGAIFKFQNLSDVSYNQRSQVKIEPQNKWLSNEMERQGEIKKFKIAIESKLSEIPSDSVEKENSSIYLPIVRELNQLSQSKSDRKILVVYSDLMENTPEFSFYRKEDFELVKNQPYSLQKRFEKELLISPLSGVEIYFIYQPKDLKSDARFLIISEFYKKLLESKGAKVTISANLNF
ncbi:MAG TPA: hypothetical protein PLN13_09205 [Bacteroidia bacterium]|nr:hypothetical protein [Bacteroidia bacterium]HRH08745.1 hypothetical protein [Bacteroidia bacterium]